MTPEGLKTEIVSFDRGASPQFMEGTYRLLKISPADRLAKRTDRANNTKSPTSRLTKSKRPKIARAIHQIEGVRAHGANR